MAEVKERHDQVRLKQLQVEKETMLAKVDAAAAQQKALAYERERKEVSISLMTPVNRVCRSRSWPRNSANWKSRSRRTRRNSSRWKSRRSASRPTR